MGPINTADAAYGIGYRDGQCARDLKWVNGKANSEDWILNELGPYNNSGEGNMGACCAEMDLWEANMILHSRYLDTSHNHVSRNS